MYRRTARLRSGEKRALQRHSAVRKPGRGRRYSAQPTDHLLQALHDSWATSVGYHRIAGYPPLRVRLHSDWPAHRTCSSLVIGSAPERGM
jgi:hypothetical protein